jgi:hypothetical protein
MKAAQLAWGVYGRSSKYSPESSFLPGLVGFWLKKYLLLLQPFEPCTNGLQTV